jgi:plastocyanin
MRAIAKTLAVVLFALPLTAATLEVRVTDAGGKAIRDAVVYAVPPQQMPLAKNTAVMDQIDRTFIPHVLPVQTGTWVQFPNSDNIRHQVYSVSPVRRFQLPLYIGKPAYPVQFPKAGVVPIGCNIHEQMSAYIVVVDTPYFATVEKGQASLADVAAGTYTVRVWYPGMKSEPEPQAVTIADGETRQVTFAIRK